MWKTPIDLTGIKDKREIINFLYKPFPCCRYCKTKEMQFGEKWGITKKEITEWT
jgi:hypothetical protein